MIAEIPEEELQDDNPVDDPYDICPDCELPYNECKCEHERGYN